MKLPSITAVTFATFCMVPAIAKAAAIGVGHFRFPHYMGSAESYQYTFFYPFVANDYLFFYKPGNFTVTWDFRLTLPIRGDRVGAPEPDGYLAKRTNIVRPKSYARRGMGYTPPGLFLGPKIGFRMGNVSLTAASMPGIALGKDWGHIGFLHRGSVKMALWTNRNVEKAGCLCVYVDGYWSSAGYNDTYYSVATSDALPGRAAYDAKRAGYLGLNTRLYAIKRFGSWSMMAFISHQNMTDAVIADSPLVFNLEGFSAGAGVAYRIWD